MVALTVLLWVISPAMAAGKPNIIVIFTDDQGYADVACQGVLDDLKTPNLDRLAADGVRCTNGYVTAPQCIPSRAGILTGCYQQRFGVDHNGGIPLPLEVTTIPQRLGEAGYVTGQVGKWHLEPNWQETEWVREHMPEVKPGEKPSIPGKLARPYLPDKRGFNEMFCGYINQYLASYNLDGKDVSPPKNIKTPGYRLDTQTDAALAFIDRHADKPFFLYLAYFAPHVPLDATDKYLQRFPENMPRRRRLALAMIAAIDEGVGRLRDSLRQHGLTDNTLIFFISDNGAPLKIDMKDEPGVGPGWDGSRNDPLVGEKGMLTEGGIRVPFFVTWPGTIPAGKTYDQPVISLDVGATAVALAGLDKPAELDGVNILPYLKGENTLPPHETLYWRFWQQTAVRKGQWKYLQAGADLQYLFDLTSPEQEHKNLIHEHPEIAAELRASLKTWAHPLKNPGVPVGPLSPAEVKWFDVYLPH
ncbi:MAG: sulfatase-like hydrolase/transferase [Phycisphaera sp.]|nr:sulfatase-like hydrolase/transferase [Phycisphaera sp.]